MITTHVDQGTHRAGAYALAGLILLVLACSFPFMAFERAGFGNQMTLPYACIALFDEGAVVLAGLVFAFILTVPAVLLGTLLCLVYALQFRRAWKALPLMGRLLTQLRPWSMVEVFIIGVIVSLVKLVSMADIVLGIAFWAYAGFALCFTAAFASIDQHDLWDAIEDVGP